MTLVPPPWRGGSVYTMPPWFRPGFWTNNNHGKHGCTDVDGPMILIVGWVTRYLTSIQLRTGEDSSILATTEMFGACKTWVELANLNCWLATGKCQKMRMFVCLAENTETQWIPWRLRKGPLKLRIAWWCWFFPPKNRGFFWKWHAPQRNVPKKQKSALDIWFPFQHFWPKQVLH